MKKRIESTMVIDEAKATVKKRRIDTITITFFFLYLLIVLLMAFGNFALILIYGLFDENAAQALINSSEEVANVSTAITLGLNVLLIIVPVIYCTRYERRRFFTLGFIKEGAVTEYILGLLIGLGMFSVSFLMIYATGGFDNVEINYQIPWRFIIIMFLGYIIQGMAEEVSMRGYYMVSVAAANSLPVAIFASSFLFTLLHVGNEGLNVIGICNIFLFGVFAALYFIRRGNIWGIAALHTMWNFAQGNLFGCSVSGHTTTQSIIIANQNDITLINGGKFGPEGGLAVTIVLCLGIVALYFMKNKEQKCEIDV